MENILYLLIGVLLGGALVWLFLKSKVAGDGSLVPKAMYEELKGREQHTQRQLEHKAQALDEIGRDLAASEKTVEFYHEKLKNQQLEIEQMREKMERDFEAVASKLLEEKSMKFTEQNRTGIDQLLKPMREKMFEFEQRVDQAHKLESEQRARLSEQIRMLADLNLQMSDEARRLTNAMRGDNKAQGNWGEMILEKVLESSGLTKGREYITQSNHNDEDGRRKMPDIIINLPDEKHLVVDSKVSLLAYERYVNSQDLATQAQSLKELLVSMRTHVRQLGEKKYHHLEGLTTPDFVLMFVPLESAFAVAIQHDPELPHLAMSSNVVIVSPTTLLATAKTIASLWRQEQQSKNALEIARQGGELFDKFVSFADDMKLFSTKLDGAQRSFDGLMNKLVHGKGSLSSRASRLKELGAKTSKQLGLGSEEE